MPAFPCGEAADHYFEIPTFDMPRGTEPLLRKAVHGCGTDIYVEHLRPSSCGRHTYTCWVKLFAFPPARVECKLWSPFGESRSIRFEGGKALTVPPQWALAFRWDTPADAIVLFSRPAFVSRYFSASCLEPAIEDLTEYFAAAPQIVDVCTDLRRYAKVPNGSSDWRVGTGGSYLAGLAFEAQSMFVGGKFRPTGLFADIVAKMSEHLEKHKSRRVPINEIATTLGISGRKLRRVVREETGKSPQEWAREQKAKQFRALIAEGRTTKEAWEATGFSNASHAHRVIKKVYGGSPRAFRGQKKNGPLGGL